LCEIGQVTDSVGVAQVTPELAEKVRAAVEAHEFRLDDGTLLKRTCSVGFAAYPLSTRQPRACSWQEIVGIADHGLYAAKRKGRNGWVGLEAEDSEDPLETMQSFRENPESSVVDAPSTLNERAAKVAS